MKLQEHCARYIAALRALYLTHQNNHWIIFGANFYGNHLLFERLYKSAQDNADMAAEKLIGNFGIEALDAYKQPGFIHDYWGDYADYSNEDILKNILKNALKAEQKFLELSETFYQFLKSENKLSLGCDDAIMSIANSREEAVYLLKQTLGENMNKLSMLANKFARKLAQVVPAQSGALNQADQLKQKLRTALAVNLGNRNWGEVGFNSLSVEDQNGTMTVKYNLIMPKDSPPFMDRNKYPMGLNQFKQEMMDFVSQTAEQMGVADNLLQVITVNDQ